jgi:hypothetical protein
MEKKFTLMKTLTAFLDLLFPHRKNSRAVNNGYASTTGGCGTTTTVNNHFIYMNDPDKSGSFLFFYDVAIDGQQSTGNGQEVIDNNDKSKSKEDSDSYREKKVNDELAQRNIPRPTHNNWKQRVNDDLAACSPVVSRESVIVSRESITVINVLESIFPKTTAVDNETRTNKNDASLPFASFSFFVRRLVRRNFNEGESVGEGSFFSTIISAFSKCFKQESFNKNLKPVFLPIPQSKIRFLGSVTDQNRFK